mgnify:CR=1 FL=1
MKNQENLRLLSCGIIFATDTLFDYPFFLFGIGLTLNTQTFFFWGINGDARGELDKRLSLFVYYHGRL